MELWDTKPISKSENRDESILQQERRIQFAKKVLPFMLKMTMGHPIATVNYSKTSGSVLTLKRNWKGKPIVLKNDNDINNWLNATGRFEKSGTAVFTKGFMTLFVELNPKEPINIGIFDIDIVEPEMLPKAGDVVSKIVNILDLKNKFKVLAIFTGSSWQVWFHRKDGKPLGSYRFVRDKYIIPIGKKSGATVPKTVKKKTKGKVIVDYSVNAKRRLIRFPFSQHQKTGLVCAPITTNLYSIISNMSHSPEVYAHPDNVTTQLERYKNVVSDFFSTTTIKKSKSGKTIQKRLLKLQKVFEGWNIEVKQLDGISNPETKDAEYYMKDELKATGEYLDLSEKLKEKHPIESKVILQQSRDEIKHFKFAKHLKEKGILENPFRDEGYWWLPQTNPVNLDDIKIVTTEDDDQFKLTVYVGEKQAGYLTLWIDDDQGHFSFLKINKGFRQQGLAKILIIAGITLFKQRGAKYISITAQPLFDKSVPVDALVSFYEKFGFREVPGRGKEIVPMEIKLTRRE